MNAEELREFLREKCKTDLYWLCKSVLGYRDLTVDFHLPLCRYIQLDLPRRLMLIPRGNFKTSIDSIGHTIQSILKDPEIPILLAACTADRAHVIGGQIMTHLERNEVLKFAFPDIIPATFDKVKWTEDAFEVLRKGRYPDPTVTIAGVGKRITGGHYRLIKGDDLIELEASQSDDIMNKSFRWFTGLPNLLIEPEKDRIQLNGTRWTAKSNELYYLILNGKEYAEYDVLQRSAIEKGKDGNRYSIFPERFSLDYLDSMKRKDPYLFACQQMNNPVSEETSDFAFEWLQYYTTTPEGGFQLERPDGIRIRWRKDDLRITATCDPAIGTDKRASRSAIIVVGVTPNSEKVLLEAWAQRVNPHLLLRKIIETQRRWGAVEFGIESVAFQKVFRYYYEEIRRNDPTCPYINWKELKPGTRAAKEKRIAGIQPFIRDGSLYIQQGMSDFIDEYLRFPLGDTEDLLDALAMQIELWRLPTTYADKRAMERAYKDFTRKTNPLTGY